jgi:hypothetical protein
MYSCLVKVAHLFLQRHVRGVLQCLVIGLKFSLQGFSKDQAGDNLLVQGQDFRADAAAHCIQNL